MVMIIIIIISSSSSSSSSSMIVIMIIIMIIIIIIIIISSSISSSSSSISISIQLIRLIIIIIIGRRRLSLFFNDCPDIGARYCTPEINTSEIIVDYQWHSPMDCQWHFPTEFHVSAVCSVGSSLVQWILPELSDGSPAAFSNGSSLL